MPPLGAAWYDGGMPATTPQFLLKAIQSSPRTGLDLALSMIEDGRLDINEPVEDGVGFMDALVDLAIHGPDGRTTNIFSDSLSQTLFSMETQSRWLSATQGGAFSRRTRRGEWAPMEFLSTIEKLDGKKSSSMGMSRYNTYADKSTGQEKKDLDKWLPEVIETLPEAFWSEVGGDFLAKLLQLGMKASSHRAWLRASPVSSTREGVPAILSARFAPDWKRFVEEGHSTSTPVNGVPLWKVLLDRALEKSPPGANTFLGAFERWFVEDAIERPEMRGEIVGLAQKRLSHLSTYGAERWVSLFRASSGKWPQWNIREGKPVWERVAIGLGIDFFAEIERYPEMVKKIDPVVFSKLKINTLLRDLSSGGVNKGPVVSQLIDMIKSQGWSAALPLGATHMVEFGLSQKQVDAIRGAMGEDAWWGVGGAREKQEKDLVLMLPSLAKKKVPNWIAATCDNPGSAWIEVGRGIASSIGAPMKHIREVSSASAAEVAKDEDGLKMLHEMKKMFSGSRLREYAAWVDAAELQANSVPALARRSSPRL